MIANLIKPASEWTPGAVGIFAGLDAEKYHTEAAGLGSSMARTLKYRSPAHLREELDHPKPATPFMVVGTEVHCATLEPDKLIGSYYIRPDTRPAEKDCTAVKKGRAKPGDPIEWDNKAGYCIQWNAAHADKPILSREKHEAVLGCCEALRANTDLAAMLKIGHAELSCFARWEGTLVKCRPDLLAVKPTVDQVWVLDIKKVQDASYRAFRRDAIARHFDFQQVWYDFVLSLCGIRAYSFRFFGVEENRPHGVKSYRIGDKTLTAARPKIFEAIDSYSQCVESGQWPNYGQDTEEIEWGTIT